MTYLEFYQVWADLVTPNSQTVIETVNTIKIIDCTYPSSISSYIKTALVLTGIPAFLIWFSYLSLRRKKPKSGTWITLIIYSLLLAVVTNFASDSDSDSDSYKKLTCKNIYNTVKESSIKYPEYDYTVEEFEKNLVILSQDASPEQIELARTVLKNCLKNLPINYQVNHSSIVRSCITDVDTKTIFGSKDVEIYKNKVINELNTINK